MSMNLIVILTALIVALVGAAPAGAQDKDSKDRGGIGGVLDTLGGLLGSGSSSKLQGAVVTAHDTSVVVRTDDKRSVRVDTASIDPQVRQQLVPGQKVTVTARGGGDVLTASDIQVEQGQAAPQAFSRVTGTVQERTNGRILFKTKEGLTLPVDTSQIRGLPYLAANTPATLIYEQGPKQEINAVWIEAGDSAVSASPAAEPAASQPKGSQPAASLPSGAAGAARRRHGRHLHGAAPHARGSGGGRRPGGRRRRRGEPALGRPHDADPEDHHAAAGGERRCRAGRGRRDSR